jgi:hypothetical protein
MKMFAVIDCAVLASTANWGGLWHYKCHRGLIQCNETHILLAQETSLSVVQIASQKGKLFPDTFMIPTIGTNQHERQNILGLLSTEITPIGNKQWPAKALTIS